MGLTDIKQLLPTDIFQGLINAVAPSAANPFVTTSQIAPITTVNTARLLGRYSAGVGAVEEITIGAGLSLSGLGVLSATNTGTVTSFSAGALAPLFTTSVATPTTTPALSFALSNAAASTWFGNNTAGVAAPAYNSAGALSRVNDTNVTLVLGGSPLTALLNGVSLTLGWAGTLSTTRGGTGTGAFTGNRMIVSNPGGTALIAHTAQVTNQIAYYNASGLPTGDVGFTKEDVGGFGYGVNPTIRSQTGNGAPLLNIVGDGASFPGINGIFFYDNVLTVEFQLLLDFTTPGNEFLSIGGAGGGQFKILNTTGVVQIGIAGSGLYGTTGNLNIDQSSIALAHINLSPGVVPTAPTDGDIFYVGTDLFMQRGALLSKFAFDSLTLAYVAVAGVYTALNTDTTINATSGTFTINLPTAVGITGKIYIVKNSGAGVITIDPFGAQTVDGSLTVPLVTMVSLTVMSNGANWIII